MREFNYSKYRDFKWDMAPAAALFMRGFSPKKERYPLCDSRLSLLKTDVAIPRKIRYNSITLWITVNLGGANDGLYCSRA